MVFGASFFVKSLSTVHASTLLLYVVIDAVEGKAMTLIGLVILQYC